MARQAFEMKYEHTEKLLNAMDEYGKGSGQVIDEVLHTKGGQLINDRIMQLLPESGRKWKGKKTAAKRAKPFEQKDESLAVTIRTKYAYHYLYFPDDGTNTKNHRGQQYFMYQGAEDKSAEIIDLCVDRLIKKWEGE